MDYMRKVIYLKKRENEIMMQGQGFARLEKRGDNLSLHLSIHDISLPGDNPVYIVCEETGIYKAFQIGSAGQADNWDFRTLLGDLPKGLILGNICGILVGSREHYLSGLCPEHPGTLLYDQVEFETEAEPEQESELNEPVKQEPEDQAEPVAYREPEIQKEEEKKLEEPEASSNAEVKQEEEPRAGQEPEADISAEAEPEPEPALKRDSFLKGLSEMYPFEDDEIEWCLQMRPEDFNQFPMEYWHYAKNSFLLQGFYNYRHLVYAHTKGKNYVGVPGQYIRKEQYLAARFGFHLFKQVRRKKLSMGDYGYWLKEL